MINLFKFHLGQSKVYLQDGDSVKGEGVDAVDKAMQSAQN